MRTLEIKVYKFNELPEAAKQKALDKLYDINVDHDWWEFTYDDAKEVDIKINTFDIEFFDSAIIVAEKIIEKHGEKCDTYKIAKSFYDQWHKLGEDDDHDEIENEFQSDIGQDYLSMLRKEYEYRTSEKAIIETIEANDYEFTEDGEIY